MSADGYGFARKSHDLPVIRVIGSVAADAAADARNRIVWVIGTPLSINSGLYHETISRLDSIIVIYQRDFRPSRYIIITQVAVLRSLQRDTRENNRLSKEGEY